MIRAWRKGDRLSELAQAWRAAWPAALAAWSKFTRLSDPTLCETQDHARREGLTGSFAMIRFADQAVIVSLPEVVECGVEDFAVEVLAHEVGHHVLAPGNLGDHTRMLARMRRALPTVERFAPQLANLYTDLLINDRLQRSAGLRMAEVYRTLCRRAHEQEEQGGALWAVYLRIYEVLWSLPRRDLGGGATTDAMEGDAWIGARLLRSYAKDAVSGSGRFAALMLPYVLKDQDSQALVDRLFDLHGAGAGAEPEGMVEIEADETEGALHPVNDPALNGEDGELEASEQEAPPKEASHEHVAHGQARQPFEYGEILRAAGLTLDDHEVAVRYYRELARPHLVRFPTRQAKRSIDQLPEGLEPWDVGHPIEAADWLQSVLGSPRVIPGVTTVQRVWGQSEGRSPRAEPLDLDLYVDSSGSMQNPQHLLSFPALAGAVICLSALRAGASVQATLWSGTHQFEGTRGFVRDEHALLRVLTGYFGGGTAFPIHVLRDTFEKRDPSARPAHVMVVSDDGVTTMFDRDERGQSGWDVTRAALQSARGGGTLVLQLMEQWEQHRAFDAIVRARDELGFQVHRVASWEGLLEFAREWSRRHYSGAAEKAR